MRCFHMNNLDLDQIITKWVALIVSKLSIYYRPIRLFLELDPLIYQLYIL